MWDLPPPGEPGRIRKKLILMGFVHPITLEWLVDDCGRKPRRNGYKPVSRSKPAGWVRQDGQCKQTKWRWEYTNSVWWTMLKDERTYDLTSYVGKQFRRDFRVPRVIFDELLKEVNTVSSLKDKAAGPGHGRGPDRVPTCMKLLGALYKLAKGVDFRTLHLIAHIEAGTMRRWFHCWVKLMGEGTLYEEHVRSWATQQELVSHVSVYNKLGFPGVMPSRTAPKTLLRAMRGECYSKWLHASLRRCCGLSGRC